MDSPSRFLRQQARLRALGLLVLLLGLGSASVIYWRGAHSSDASRGVRPDDPLSVEDSKRASRDVEIYYGKTGLLGMKLWQQMQRPGSLAILIAAVSTLTAGGCFLFAHGPPIPVKQAEGGEPENREVQDNK